MSTPYAMLALEGGVGVGSPQRRAGLLGKSLRIASHCATYDQVLGTGILKTGSRIAPVCSFCYDTNFYRRSCCKGRMKQMSEGFGAGCIKHQVMSFPFPVTQSLFLNSAKIGKLGSGY